MAKYTLHTNYDAANVDDRFWCGPIPTGRLGAIQPGAGRLGSIEEARRRAAETLGCAVSDVAVARYLLD